MDNDEHFEALLIECLAAMEAGATVEQLLARYPDDATQLDTALRVAASLSALGGDGPAPAQQSQARAAFLARAAAMRPTARPTFWLRRLVWPFVSFVTVAVLLVVIGMGVRRASAVSLPGDPLYSVKRSFESFQLSLARDPVQRVNLEESYSQRRVEEVRTMQASGRAASIQFAAPIEAMNAEWWTVGGFTVQVPPGTPIQGTPEVSDFVQVTGRILAEGQIAADQIEVESQEFVGVVKAMDARVWNIGGQPVLVTTRTLIVGTPKLGTQAQVQARTFPDGILLALRIESSPSETPATPQPTATPKPTFTSTPTPLPISTLRPMPSSTLHPTWPPRIETPHPAATHERNTPEPKPTEGRDDKGTPESRPTDDHGGKRTPESEPSDDHGGKSTPEPKSTQNPGEH